MLRHIGKDASGWAGLVANGPIVEVTLSHALPALAESKIAAPIGAAVVRVMVDTGARFTCVEDRITNSLGLKPIRYRPIRGVSQETQMCPVYRMSLTIGMADPRGTARQVTWTSEVVGVPSPPSPAEHVGLLGRDFLRHVRLVYEGAEGTFQLQSKDDTATKSRSIDASSDKKKSKAKTRSKIAKKSKKKSRK